MNKFIINYFVLSIFFILISLFFFNFENLQFLDNRIFPYDAIVYKDLALGLFDEKYHETVDYRNTIIYHPHTSKLIYPLISGFIKNYLDLELIYSMFYLNLASTYLVAIISYFLINKIVNNSFISLFSIIFFLIIWNAPLRATFYNPSNGFAFDVLLISLFTFFSFILDEKKKINLFFILLLLVILSFQRFFVATFLVIIPIIITTISKLQFQKFDINYLSKIQISSEDKLKIVSLVFVFFFISINTEQIGSYSRIKFLIKFLYFHSNPFEFIYTYYYAYGALFLLLIYCISFNEFRTSIRKKFNGYNQIQKSLLLTFFFSSVILSTIGGDDSDRMLIWFFIWHLILFSLCLKFIIDKKSHFIFIIFLIIHLFGSRILTQGTPVITLSDSFLYYNQQATTDFNDKYFKGPIFLKKFRNKLEDFSITTLPGIYEDNKSKKISTYLPVGKIKNDGSIDIYRQPYLYRINDMPIPLGYLHNQRNALVDHPWHGKWWVRFMFLIQWIFIQILLFLYYWYKKK